MNMVVRQFPPSESCKMRVILLSRYGTWDFYKDKEKTDTRRLKDHGGHLNFCATMHILKTKNKCCENQHRTKKEEDSLSICCIS